MFVSHMQPRSHAKLDRSDWCRFARLLLLALACAGCAVDPVDLPAARQEAQDALPSGDVRLGWRVFQQNCAACHGVAGTGSAKGPDLLPRIREMGAHQFAALVLRRYDWIFAAAESGGEAALQDPLTEKVVRGRDGDIAMPAWQGNPSVTAHIDDLYAYLAARADGSLPRGRP